MEQMKYLNVVPLCYSNGVLYYIAEQVGPYRFCWIVDFAQYFLF